MISCSVVYLVNRWEKVRKQIQERFKWGTWWEKDQFVQCGVEIWLWWVFVGSNPIH
jgi:hypothetical protein